MGTPAYMSPEQTSGRSDQLGPASDVYSLGATLYHILTGRAPFEGTGLHETLDRVRRGDFPPPRRVKPGVPAALEAICLKAMALDPGDRYATAQELARDVEHWLGDEPVRAYPEAWPVRLSRWVRRNRVPLSLVALLLMAALAASALFLWHVALQDNRELAAEKRQLGSEITAARKEKGRLDQEKDLLAGEIADKKNVSRVQSIRQIDQLYSLGRTGSALEALRVYERDDPEGKDRFEVGYLRGLFKPNSRALDGHTADIKAIHAADDGRTIMTAAEDGTIRTWNLETGRVRSVVRFLPGVVGLGFAQEKDGSLAINFVQPGSPAARSGKIARGDRLVSVAEPGSKAIPVRGLSVQRVIELIQGPPGTELDLNLARPASGEARTVRLRRDEPSFRWGPHRAFSPDGRWLAFSDGDGTAVHLVESATGRLHRRAFAKPTDEPAAPVFAAQGAIPRVCALAFAPDSSRIAVGFVDDLRVFVGDPGTRRWVKSYKGSGVAPFGMAWSADGKWLFSGNGGDVGLGAWDVAGGRRAWQPNPSISSPGEEMQVSRDGSWLIWGGSSDTYLVRIRPAYTDYTPFQALPRASGSLPIYSFAPSGKLIATSDQSRIFLWSTRQGRHLRLYEADRGIIRCLGFSLDSRRLLAGIDSRLVIYDLDVEGGSRILSFGVGDHLTTAEFDPGRDRLLAAVGDSQARIREYEPTSDARARRVFGPEWPQMSGNLAISPDGRRLAVIKSPMELDALEGSTVEIWDVPGRRLISTGRLPVPSGVFDLCYSPDGRMLAVARWHGLEQNNAQLESSSLRGLREYPAFVLDGETGKVLGRLVHSSSCYMSRFTPDSKRLVTLSGGEVGERVTIWDLEDRVPTGWLMVEANAIALSRDGKWLATAYHGPSYSQFGRPVAFSVYDLEGRKPVATWRQEDMTGRVDTTALQFSPDGRLLAAGSMDGHVGAWDWARKERVARDRSPGARDGAGVLSLTFHPAGRSLLVSTDRMPPSLGGKDGVVLRWDFREGRFEPLAGQMNNPILCPPSADGKLAILSPFTNEVSIRDLATGAAFDLGPSHDAPKGEIAGAITALALRGDGRILALVEDYRTVRLMDRERGRVVHTWEGVFETVEAIRFSPDGRELYAAGRQARPNAGRAGAVVGWDVQSKRERSRWEGPALGSVADLPMSRRYVLVGLSGDARAVAFAASSSKDSKVPAVEVRDARSGERAASFRGDDADVRSYVGVVLDWSARTLLALSMEGLGPGADGGAAYFVRLWDVGTGRMLHRFPITGDFRKHPDEGPMRAALSPDGRLAAVGKIAPQVDLWDVATGLKLISLDLEHGGAIDVLQFSPDGKGLVAASFGGNAKLFRARE
jgi:WD40 repeat protein